MDSREVPRLAVHRPRAGRLGRERSATPFRFRPFGRRLDALVIREGSLPGLHAHVVRRLLQHDATRGHIRELRSLRRRCRRGSPLSRRRSDRPVALDTEDLPDPSLAREERLAPGGRPRIRCRQSARAGTGSAHDRDESAKIRLGTRPAKVGPGLGSDTFHRQRVRHRATSMPSSGPLAATAAQGRRLSYPASTGR